MAATPEAADEALVRATLHGDQQAFARLVRRYLRKAMAVAMEFAGNRSDAEDVVQEAFRRAYQNLSRFDPERRFEPWFFTILRNAARNTIQSERLRQHDLLNPDQVAHTPGPADDLQRSELRRQITEAMERLPPMQKTCFRLCLIEGLTSVETADALGVAESTVRVHVFKARQSMQRFLSAWRDDLEEA